MKKIHFRLVYNRKKKLNADGTALIQVEAYLERQKIYLSTHVYVKPEQWDKRKALITAHPLGEELNRMINEFILRLQLRELDAWKRGSLIDLSLIKEYSMEKEPRMDDFISFGRKWVEHSSKKVNTRKNLLTTLALLEEFRPSISPNDITYTFLVEFENFMRKRNYAVNTLAKHMKHLKTFVNEAINQGHLPVNAYPFRKYRIKMVDSKHSFLLPGEMERLERLTLSDESAHLQHALDAFLFCCYTGLRYSDFTHLTTANFFCPDCPEQQWLIFKSIKTGTETRLPLYLLFEGKALLRLAPYKEDVDAFFRLKSNSQVNKALIKIGEIAKLKKHFSFHTARHTNASLLIYQGVQITTVQKLLGHRSIKTTQGYSNVFEATIIKDLKKCTPSAKGRKKQAPIDGST